MQIVYLVLGQGVTAHYDYERRLNIVGVDSEGRPFHLKLYSDEQDRLKDIVAARPSTTE